MFSTDTAQVLKEQVATQAQAAKIAARELARKTSEEKNAALELMAASLVASKHEILQANAQDVSRVSATGAAKSFIDRLTLTPARIQSIADGVRAVMALPDPIGVTQERWQLRNGVLVERRSVPLGVIAMIYEARPNVTVDAATLALKTSNAVVLRGSADALESNRAIVVALREGLRASEVPAEAIQLIESVEHESVEYLIRMRDAIDLVIPRGGARLIQAVVESSVVPVIETGVGNCHVYVDVDAQPEMATKIVINAKTQRPSVCNAAETLLVHTDVAPQWLPQALKALQERGVEIRGCARTCQLVPDIESASEQDWGTEYLELIMAVKIVDDVQEAIEHIARYGTRHTESIITENEETAALFLEQVDAAVVYHNASTRLTDGFVFGFGAEIGISTQKMHARGPMGLQALTSYKYVGHGSGQVIE
ncbi:glutamate-5-semialdehyde dehydrogenase [Ktedonobacter racemifer]|uniref:Gamma-glutamyl phosphate reductase n=1 Tax=Ktedonobacter racemifer DSM 44963 TaxID=485913 RepID=D6U0R0_KTERA|nr:glutamate-5-semialdehyde dehydrogenase [Ktedonobacter racemifer]EFH82400.1 gamma-glutamyl phosphate reductase [Ktedonobacter racemifer DSM 44963]